jgi:anti-sigma factor ChrR (cupin superfamily)
VTAPVSLHVDPDARAGVEARAGVHWNVLWEEGDRKALLVRDAPGAAIPRHRHLGDEQIFVLEGSVSDDTGTGHTGQYARRPPGCVHAVASPEGALVLATITGGGTEPLA